MTFLLPATLFLWLEDSSIILKIVVVFTSAKNIEKSTTKASHGRSPNDQRSDAKNPTSQEYKHAMDNRSVQLNQQNQEKHE